MLTLTETGGPLTAASRTNGSCHPASVGFRELSGNPALAGFDHSVLGRQSVAPRRDIEIERTEGRRLPECLLGANGVALANGQRFADDLRKRGASKGLSTIRGGNRDAWITALHEAWAINVVSFDIVRALGESPAWPIRYMARILTRGERLAIVAGKFLFWPLFLAWFIDPRCASNGACGVFFLGRGGCGRLGLCEAISYYHGVH
jgi:hypothetical protein